MKKKSKIILGVCIVAAALIGMSVWNTWFSPTKIAFINFQTIQQGSISKANDNSSIKLSEVSLDNLDRLNGYDMVFINGMGLRIVEEQRQQIQQAADKGIPVYTSMATNPANNICNLDSVQQNLIRGYLTNGGKTNYRNMLNYIRKAIDGKISSIPEVEDPAERPSDMLYHAGLTNPDDELEFLTVADYEKFMKDNRLYKEGARKIMITGQMADATGLIEALEKEGYNVYPVQSMTKFMSFIDEVQPNAIINMAHGRMGDKMVDYLKAKNILLFAPLTINSLVDEWEKDPMGMAGGFMSQSIVTPEIDGAIRPFALFAQYEDEEGLRHSYAVPERLKTFVSTINNYLNLNTKPNSEKKVAIYYYKGPGQNALTAAGMEVVPSLYNLLVRMKQEGYNISGLPANAEKLGKMIQAQGAVFNSYAEGAFNDFMQKGHPELITKDQYESWVKKSLRPEKYQEVVDAFGEFPGNYMATNDGKLGIARLQLLLHPFLNSGELCHVVQNRILQIGRAGAHNHQKLVGFPLEHLTDFPVPCRLERLHPRGQGILCLKFGRQGQLAVYRHRHPESPSFCTELFNPPCPGWPPAAVRCPRPYRRAAYRSARRSPAAFPGYRPPSLWLFFFPPSGQGIPAEQRLPDRRSR